jgi:hypothetical protein
VREALFNHTAHSPRSSADHTSVNAEARCGNVKKLSLANRLLEPLTGATSRLLNGSGLRSSPNRTPHFFFIRHSLTNFFLFHFPSILTGPNFNRGIQREALNALIRGNR